MPGVPFSVIVATRNRADYLPATLDSLAAQCCRSAFEVVVVDNASTDETPAVLEHYCRQDRRFTAGHEPDVGHSRAKNTGVRNARGRTLLFTDDDIVLGRHWIAAYDDFLNRRSEQLLLVGGPIVPIPNDLGEWPSWLGRGGLTEFSLPEYGERALAQSEYVWGANMALSRALFVETGPWNEDVGHRADQRGTFEDAEYQDRVRAAGHAVWFVPRAYVRHRVERATVTPRQVLAASHGRGAYDFHRGRDRSPPAGRYALPLGLGRLAFALIGQAAWSAAFRLAPTGWAFERARHSAYTTGYRLERLQAGREDSRGFRSVRRGVARCRRLTLELAPERAEGLPRMRRRAIMRSGG